MARWTIGEAEIDELLSGGELQKLTGDAANGTLLLAKASKTLATAVLPHTKWTLIGGVMKPYAPLA